MQPGSIINQRYKVVRPLGQGGMGFVLLVHDTHHGNRPIALKILRSQTGETAPVELFKDEFRSMTRLRHPNLAEVYDFGTIAEDGRHFLTMEYVAGTDLAALPRVEASARVDDLTVQCLRALDYIHARGLLHNDIKPQNIMVRPPFQVKLLDFGLAQASSGPGREGVSGTVHYIAPERFRTAGVDPRSDLYSLGAVLYEVLTGTLPYQGEDAGMVVLAILQGKLRPARSVDAGVSERLDRFVSALLEVDPARRPPSASAALALLDAGAATYALDTPETRASYVTSGRFIGRDAELADLLATADAHVTRPGDDAQPRLVVISGPSGIGKSRLLRELKFRLQLGGVRNVTGRFYQDGGVPLSGFREVALQMPLHGEPPDHLADVYALWLRAGDGAAAARLDKEAFIEGVAASLDHVARDAPGIAFLEDLQWCAAPDVELLEHVLQRPHRGPWLFIVSLRDGDVQPGLHALLQRFAGSARVRRFELAPLGRGHVADLLASMVPFEEAPGTLADLLAARTEGNPLYIEELMKALADEGTLRRGVSGRWIAESRTLDAIRLPPSLLGALAARLATLTGPARDVAETLATFNRPVAATLLAETLGHDPAVTGALVEALDQLRIAAVEPGRSGPPLVSLTHSRIREAIYDELADDRRRALHAAAGAALEAAHAPALDDIVEELAHHFAAAGDVPRGAAYCLRAGAKADKLFDPHRQVEFLDRALALLPPGDPRRLPALAQVSRTRALDLADPAAALRASRQMQDEARQARSGLYEAKALVDIGWTLNFQEETTAACDAVQRGVALARAAGDTSEIARALNALAIVLARSGRHQEAEAAFSEGAACAEKAGDQGLVATILSNAALNLLGMGQPVKAVAALERTIEIVKAERLVYTYQRIIANLGAARHETGDLTAAIAVLEESLVWAREHAHHEVVGHLLSNLGEYYALDGRFDRALAGLAEHRVLRAERGDIASLLPALDFVGIAERDLGRPARAEAAHREGLDHARRLGLRLQEGFFVAGLAADRVEAGGLDEAAALADDALALGREVDHQRVLCLALCTQALVAAGRGEGKVLAGVQRSLTNLDSRRLRYHDRLRINLTIGRSMLLLGRPAEALREARAGLAGSESGGFREYAWRFHALAGAAHASEKLAEESAAAYNAARSIVRQVAASIDDRVVRDDYLNAEGRRAILRLVDEHAPAPFVPEAPVGASDTSSMQMLAAMHEITQLINSIPDLKELLNKVMDLAITSVDAERGLIFFYRSESDEMEMVVARNVERQTIKDATEYSRNVIREAGRGQAIISVDAQSDDRFKQFQSVAMYNIRSLLCVPLKISNRFIGTVYVDTRKPGVVFSNDAQRFLETFANQAAIAIEVARLHDQIRQENRYLKSAVEEKFGYENIIGRSRKIRDVFKLVKTVAPTNVTVVIRGETGTGKELIARAIHHNSDRRDRKFFAENCAAVPETLLESELFGYVRGAFTGADTTKKGLFELADGGTLFLDEVGDMSMTMQSKLLRVLQEGELRPVGSETMRHVDVRVIAATNHDLEALMRAKRFREDLYFRLKGLMITLPPLRERRDDIPLLVDHFLGKLSVKLKRPKPRVDAALMNLLTRYDWPGNVRELEYQMETLMVLASGETLTVESAAMDPEFHRKVNGAGPRGGEVGVTSDDLVRALEEAQGNRDRAAEILRISRATFFRKLKHFNLSGKKSARPARPPEVESGH